MRIVLDTNVIVSALLTPQGPPAAVLREARARALVLVTSSPLLEELARIVSSGRILRRLTPGSADRELFLREVEELSELVEPAPGVAASRDPGDDLVLATAIAGEADLIVTGDQDLLALGQYRGAPIVSPADFVAALEAGPSE